MLGTVTEAIGEAIGTFGRAVSSTVASAIMPSKNQPLVLLDPFTVVARFAVYSFLEPGTKLSIKDYKITYQPPGVQQKMSRTLINKDSRADFSNLTNPSRNIEIFCDSLNGHYSQDTLGQIQFLFKKCVVGIDKLLKVDDYAKDQVSSILTGFKDKVEALSKVVCEQKTIESLEAETLKGEPYKGFEAYYPSNTMDIWNETRISLIYGALNEAGNLSEEKQMEFALSTTEKILLIIDQEFERKAYQKETPTSKNNLLERGDSRGSLTSVSSFGLNPSSGLNSDTGSNFSTSASSNISNLSDGSRLSTSSRGVKGPGSNTSDGMDEDDEVNDEVNADIGVNAVSLANKANEETSPFTSLPSIYFDDSESERLTEEKKAESDDDFEEAEEIDDTEAEGDTEGEEIIEFDNLKV